MYARVAAWFGDTTVFAPGVNVIAIGWLVVAVDPSKFTHTLTELLSSNSDTLCPLTTGTVNDKVITYL